MTRYSLLVTRDRQKKKQTQGCAEEARRAVAAARLDPGAVRAILQLARGAELLNGFLRQLDRRPFAVIKVHLLVTHHGRLARQLGQSALARGGVVLHALAQRTGVVLPGVEQDRFGHLAEQVSAERGWG